MTVTSERQRAAPVARRRPAEPVIGPWLAAQSTNLNRHAAALRPFADGEFGTGAAAPSRAHVRAVNDVFAGLRRDLLRRAARVRQQTRNPDKQLHLLLADKDAAHERVRAIERVWDFYFELF